MRGIGSFRYVEIKYYGDSTINPGTMNPAIDYAGSCEEKEFDNWINISSYSISHGVYDQTEKTVNLEMVGNRVWLIARASTHRSDWGGNWKIRLKGLKFYN